MENGPEKGKYGLCWILGRREFLEDGKWDKQEVLIVRTPAGTILVSSTGNRNFEGHHLSAMILALACIPLGSGNWCYLRYDGYWLFWARVIQEHPILEN